MGPLRALGVFLAVRLGIVVGIKLLDIDVVCCVIVTDEDVVRWGGVALIEVSVKREEWDLPGLIAHTLFPRCDHVLCRIGVTLLNYG